MNHLIGIFDSSPKLNKEDFEDFFLDLTDIGYDLSFNSKSFLANDKIKYDLYKIKLIRKQEIKLRSFFMELSDEYKIFHDSIQRVKFTLHLFTTTVGMHYPLSPYVCFISSKPDTASPIDFFNLNPKIKNWIQEKNI